MVDQASVNGRGTARVPGSSRLNSTASPSSSTTSRRLPNSRPGSRPPTSGMLPASRRCRSC